MIRTFEVEVRSTVTVTVDTDARGAAEYGDALNPRRQDGIYNLETAHELIAHLAYNAVANQRDNAKQLDGWADLPENAVQMRAEHDVDEHDVREVVPA